MRRYPLCGGVYLRDTPSKETRILSPSARLFASASVQRTWVCSISSKTSVVCRRSGTTEPVLLQHMSIMVPHPMLVALLSAPLPTSMILLPLPGTGAVTVCLARMLCCPAWATG